MKPRVAFALFVSLLGVAHADENQPTEEHINITRRGTQASRPGPADYFTGSVRIDPLFEPHGSSRASGGSVTFQPGARTAWHTHPLGQTLIVTAGTG